MVSLIGHHLSMIELSTDYHRWNVIHCLMSSQPSLKWEGSRIRCNTCRYLKNRGHPIAEKRTVISYFILCGEKEKRSHPSRIQGCNNYPPIQMERESWSLWQSSRHLFIVNCWEDPCKSPTESIEWTPWTVRASTRKPVWIQERQRNNKYDLYSKTESRETPETECGPLTWPLSTLSKHLTQSVVRVFVKLWQSLAVLPNS